MGKKENDSNMKNISVIGLGHLGAPLAVCFSSKGYCVTGVDINSSAVQKVNDGVAPVFEPGLQSLLTSVRDRLKATTDFDEAIIETDITFIIVPTPSNGNGGFSTRYVKNACEAIGKSLQKKNRYHLVVLTSTVLPGATRSDVLFTLEKNSQKKCGRDFGLCYNPEFIALGSVIKNMLNPDFILIGEFDKRSGDILEDFSRNFCDNKPPITRMNFENAELTKIALNSFITTKISYANTLCEICEQLPGGNVDVVTGALGFDSRIGHKYLKGALSYGGPCFPRDNIAFAFMARHLGLEAPLAETVDKINRRQPTRLLNIILSKLPYDSTVGILGLAYKPETDVIEESPSITLVRLLLEKGIKIILYDTFAMENAKRLLGAHVEFASSIENCIKHSHVIVLAQPIKELYNIDYRWFIQRQNSPRVIIDCWRILDEKKIRGMTEYIALGVNGENH